MKPLKILLVTTFFFPDKFGGAERVVFELARGLTELGQEVTVLTHRAKGGAREERLEGFRVLRYPAVLTGSVAFYGSVYRGVRKALKDLLDEEGFDILHTHQVLSAFATFFPKSLFKGPTLHSFYAPYHQEYETQHLNGRPAAESKTRLSPLPALVSWLLKKGDRYVLNRAQGIIVLSRFNLDQAESLIGRKKGKIHIIPAGVDLGRFKPSENRAALKQSLGFPPKIPLLLSVRRLVDRMGLEDLIDAAGILAQRGINFTLAIGGDGPLREQLIARAASSSAAERIRFLGSIPEEELPSWYAGSDLFVLPTRSLEGFGMVTLEAMASGVPVAGTRVGATSEILKALDEGLLFDEAGAEAMALLLERLLKDPAGLEEWGKKARVLAERHYGWRKIVLATQKVYGALLEGR
jgi:glycosyltransferase involved in cell wall biosynthesis